MSHLRAVAGGDAAPPQRSGSATQVRAEAPARVALSCAGTTTPDGAPTLTVVVQALRLIETVTARRQSLDAHGLVTLGEDGGTAAVTPGGSRPSPEEEPAVRAAQLLAQAQGVTEGVDLLLRRRAGLSTGLAVGAADAAASLLACNALWGTGLSQAELAELGARLDPAVPFALTGATAVDRGVGQHLSPLMSRGTYQWVLALPEQGLDPAQVLSTDASQPAPRPAGADEDGPAEPPAALTAALRAGDAAALAATLRNDLEETVIALRPHLREVIDLAESAGALRALVAGTGPAVACLVPDSATAVRVSRALAASGLVASAVRADAPVAGARTVG